MGVVDFFLELSMSNIFCSSLQYLDWQMKISSWSPTKKGNLSQVLECDLYFCWRILLDSNWF